MPHEDSLKRKAHPLCQPNAAFILSIREPLHPSHLQSVETPMEQKAYSIGGYVGPLEGGMDEDVADLSRESRGLSIEYGDAACKLTFSPGCPGLCRFRKIENGPMHDSGISSEETLLGQEKVLKHRPGAVGQACECLWRILEEIKKRFCKYGRLRLCQGRILWRCISGRLTTKGMSLILSFLISPPV